MPKDKIEIEVLAKGVKEAQKDVQGLKKEIDKTGKQTQKTGDSMLGTFGAIAAGAFAAFQTIKQGMSLAKEFAQFKQSTKAMETQFGVSADKIIKELDKVAKGTISNADLISGANRAMALNVTKDVGEMAKLLEVARVRGQAMGLDTTQAFNDLVTGIGRGSPLILDNLGIITKGWAEEAKGAGQAMDAQFILNKVLADGAEILEKTGEVALTDAEKFQQMEATAKNLRLTIGEQLLPEIFKITDAFGDIGKGKGLQIVIRGVRSLVTLVRFLALQFTMTWRIFTALITPFITLIQTVIDNFDDLKTAVAGFADVLSLIKAGKPIQALQALKNVGTDTFDALKKTGGEAFDNTMANLKSQLEAGTMELTQFKESFMSIFAAIRAAEKDAELVQQEEIVSEASALDTLLIDMRRNREKQLLDIRKRAFKQGLIDEYQFTALSLGEIEKRYKREKAVRESLVSIYQDSLKAMTGAVFDFENSAMDKTKETLSAVVESIATQIIARGMALVASSIFPLNPAGIGAGSGMIAAGGAIRGLGSAAISRMGKRGQTATAAHRQGTEYSPEALSLVGEDGPELLQLPQGSRVVPNNQVTNNSNDNRNININVQANNGIELVNDLQSTYGINAFEGG